MDKDVTLVAKVRIYPDDKQALQLHDMTSQYRAGCNFVSRYIFKHHELSQPSLNKKLYHDLRENYRLKSQLAQSTIKTAIALYRAIIDKETGKPKDEQAVAKAEKRIENERAKSAQKRKRDKSRKRMKHKNRKRTMDVDGWTRVEFHKPCADLVYNRDWSFVENYCYLSINTLEKRIRVTYEPDTIDNMLSGRRFAKWGTAKIVNKHGKWFLHIPITVTVNETQLSEIGNVVGVDVGINFLAVSYDSRGKTRFFDGHAVKHKRSQYVKTRASLQKRQTPSSRRRLKRMSGRENRWMHDVNHCVSKTLVSSQPRRTLFVLEDLSGIRSKTERVRKRYRSVSVSWAFYDLQCLIEYKASLQGSQTIKVNPRYTSQCCPVCGHTEAANRNKAMHTFTCKTCGYTTNDDRIGAMNLQHKGKVYISETGST